MLAITVHGEESGFRKRSGYSSSSMYCELVKFQHPSPDKRKVVMLFLNS